MERIDPRIQPCTAHLIFQIPDLQKYEFSKFENLKFVESLSYQNQTKAVVFARFLRFRSPQQPPLPPASPTASLILRVLDVIIGSIEDRRRSSDNPLMKK